MAPTTLAPRTTLATNELTFERLIGPMAAGEFIEGYWEKAHYLTQGRDPGFYRSLLSFADIDRCLHAAQNLPEPVLSIVPPAESGRPMEERRVDEVSKDQLYGELHGGATLRLLEIERFWHPAAVLGAEIYQALHAKAHFNLYLTPPHAQAFAVHYDDHDVFVLQIEGSKDWSVFEADYPLPIEGLSRCGKGRLPPQVIAEDRGRLREKIHLEAGDLLYVPRGFYHKVATTDATSLQLSVRIQPTYWLDLVRRALDFAAFDSPDLRRALPPGFADSPTVRQEMAETFQRLAQELRHGLSFDDAMDDLVRSEVAGQVHPPDGQFEVLTHLDALGPETILRRRAGLICRLSQTPEETILHFSTTQVKGPRAIQSALEFVRDQHQFRVADLPGPLSDNSKLVLSRRLIREGLLRPLDGAFGDAPGH